MRGNLLRGEDGGKDFGMRNGMTIRWDKDVCLWIQWTLGECGLVYWGADVRMLKRVVLKNLSWNVIVEFMRLLKFSILR